MAMYDEIYTNTCCLYDQKECNNHRSSAAPTLRSKTDMHVSSTTTSTSTITFVTTTKRVTTAVKTLKTQYTSAIKQPSTLAPTENATTFPRTIPLRTIIKTPMATIASKTNNSMTNSKWRHLCTAKMEEQQRKISTQGCRFSFQDCNTICICKDTDFKQSGTLMRAPKDLTIDSNWEENRCAPTSFNGYHVQHTNATMNLSYKAATTKNKEGLNFQGHDYHKAIALSTLFFDNQRSGKLSEQVLQRVPWRGHSNLQDGCTHKNEPKLSGGFYDGGDTMKYHMVAAAALTQFTWGVYQFPLGYALAGELDNVLNIVQHSLDYWIECWLPKNESIGRFEDQVVAQVGLTALDHNITNWILPENAVDERPVFVIKGLKIIHLTEKGQLCHKTRLFSELGFVINIQNIQFSDGEKGSDLAGELSAVIAASIAVLTKHKRLSTKNAVKHLKIARALLAFSTRNSGFYHETVSKDDPDLQHIYPVS